MARKKPTAAARKKAMDRLTGRSRKIAKAGGATGNGLIVQLTKKKKRK